MARGPTKKERGSWKEDKKNEAFSPQGPMNNMHATREAFLVGTRYLKLYLEAEKKVAEVVEEAV
jgi:hypothetical protein